FFAGAAAFLAGAAFFAGAAFLAGAAFFAGAFFAVAMVAVPRCWKSRLLLPVFAGGIRWLTVMLLDK
ncbi:MAG: hypothetical protein KBG69_11550, partial [Ottowia sp.]|nr:hypothetical protein [Ottowia sp.]